MKTPNDSEKDFYCRISSDDCGEKCENDKDIARVRVLKDGQTFKLCPDCQDKECKLDSDKEVCWEEKSLEEFKQILAEKVEEK